MRLPFWIVAAGAVTGLVSAAVAAGRLPLGVSGQWVWGSLTVTTHAFDWLATGLVAAGYVAFASAGSHWVQTGPGRRAALLAALCAAGIAVQFSVQQLGFGLGKWPFVLYSPASSGYYTAARRDVASARQFLADYHQIQQDYLAQYGPLHLATHPPGLILLQYGLIRQCESSPFLTGLLLDLCPQSVREGFRAVAAGQRLPAPDQAAIWWLAVLTQLASVLTILPIYHLVRRAAGFQSGWIAAAIWPLVPAVNIFMPKSDVLYPLVTASAILFLTLGRTTATRFAAGLAAGLTVWAGMFLSLAIVSIAPIALAAMALADGTSMAKVSRAILTRLPAVALAMSVATLTLLLTTGHCLVTTWWQSYQIHATFYDAGQIGANRTYWPWVAVNPMEFAIAMGIPLAAAALAGTIALLSWNRQRLKDSPCTDRPGNASLEETNLVPLFGVAAGWWLTLFALDLSGKNLGEVARLWILLIPFACMAAAPALKRLESRAAVAVWLGLQAIQAVAFAASVQGFFDPGSVQIK